MKNAIRTIPAITVALLILLPGSGTAKKRKNHAERKRASFASGKWDRKLFTFRYQRARAKQLSRGLSLRYAGCEWPLSTFRKRYASAKKAGLTKRLRSYFAASPWTMNIFKKRLEAAGKAGKKKSAAYFAGSKWPLPVFYNRMKTGKKSGLRGRTRRLFAASPWNIDLFLKRYRKK